MHHFYKYIYKVTGFFKLEKDCEIIELNTQISSVVLIHANPEIIIFLALVSAKVLTV